MTILDDLHARSGARCELCAAEASPDAPLDAFEIDPAPNARPGARPGVEGAVLICATCRGQIENPATMDMHHWRKLGDSMWTPVPAVQVMAWRMLERLGAESWARDLLDMLYLDEDTQAWAQAGAAAAPDDSADLDAPHRDANGARLSAGDTVTLVKDLNVKGAGFTAKRGTAVRGIALVADNPRHIEGRVNNQMIVILTEFVKKSG